MGDNINDEEEMWVPPTDAELKVIEAKRERSNKISAIMGKYLLKGYKMLSTTCPICDCILLEDKRSQKYCIACSEVDDDDTKKDNPALNEHAARMTVEENFHRHPNGDTSMEYPQNLCDDISAMDESNHLENSMNESNNLPNSNGTADSNDVPGGSKVKKRRKGQLRNNPIQRPVEDTPISVSIDDNAIQKPVGKVEFSHTLKVIKQKIEWATQLLQQKNNLQRCQELAKFIEEGVKAMSAIKQYNNIQ